MWLLTALAPSGERPDFRQSIGLCVSQKMSRTVSMNRRPLVTSSRYMAMTEVFSSLAR